MKITPEDIMWGMDPFKEDLVLGFKKLPNKDQLLLKAIKYALYHRGFTGSLDAPATAGLKKFMSSVGVVHGDHRPDSDTHYWTQKANNFEKLVKQKNFARDVVDEMMVDSSLQMERDGYTQLENYSIPDELMQTIIQWTMGELVRLGILPDSEELNRTIREVYLQ
jgi:hypothetical protein